MKPKTNKAALALPSTIQPPPRKEDIINAMVERALVKHQEEKKRLEEEKQVLKAKFDVAVLAEFKSNPANFNVRVCTYSPIEIEHVMQVTPPSIEKLRKAYRDAPTLSGFDEAAAKRKIREGMNTSGDRVKALLDNPDAVKKLDAALEAISSK
jgi:hypothetical protein